MVSHAEAVKSLRICVGKKTNYRWHGSRGIANLRGGADAKLVERAMKIVLPWSPAGACYKLHDDYVAIAWRVLAKAKASPDVTFLRAYAGDDPGPRLRTACAWLLEAAMIDPKPRNRQRLPGLAADAAGLAAARTAVVAHGIEAEQMLAVLAHDGTADSLDAIVDVAHAAISERGEPLDAMIEWFVPFARGRDMTALAKELVEARDARGAASPLATKFGAKGKLHFQVSIDSRQVYEGLSRKATAHVELQSHKRPNASVLLSYRKYNDDVTIWEDGKKTCDDNRIGVPSSVEDIPRWLAASAAKLKVGWDRSTLLVWSSLRGNARERAIDWLLTPPVSTPSRPSSGTRKHRRRRA